MCFIWNLFCSFHNVCQFSTSPFLDIPTLLSLLKTKSIFSLIWLSKKSMPKMSSCSSSKLFRLLSLDREYSEELSLDRYLSKPFSWSTIHSPFSVLFRQSPVVARSFAVGSRSSSSLSLQSDVVSLMPVEPSSEPAGSLVEEVFTFWSHPSVSYGMERNW